MEYRDFMMMVFDLNENATIGEDNDGQVVIYTNYRLLSSEDNPSIPAGEVLLVDMDE